MKSVRIPAVFFLASRNFWRKSAHVDLISASLNNEEDAEECVNDTYLNAWNSMPTHWPEQLATFLGKITRNIAFNRYKHNHTEKRGGEKITLVLDELTDCISDVDDVEQIIDRQELIKMEPSIIC